MMTRIGSGDEAVRQVPFLRAKHGRELLFEAATLSDMPAFDVSTQPHALSFFDIMLVTRGSGTFTLDDTVHPVAPGALFVSRPGEVRRWRVENLDGACVFFAGEFVREAFADARFLDQFAFLRADRAGGAIMLDAAQQAQFQDRFALMRGEFDGLRDDADALLRARLYELLVMLNRWWGATQDIQNRLGQQTTVERFLALIERDFSRRRSIADYAGELGVTSGHLSVLCKAGMGCSAGVLIRRRVLLEAKRLLIFTGKPASAVAYALGFEDAAYFSRFFRRETGYSPQGFRQHRRAG